MTLAPDLPAKTCHFVLKNLGLIYLQLIQKCTSSVSLNLVVTFISILVDSSTGICWISPFVILGVSCLFYHFTLFLMENPVQN